MKKYKKYAKHYHTINDAEKKDLLTYLYHERRLSMAQIAQECGTYRQKVFRDIQKLNIETRDKSESIKNALATGSKKHPTKGKKRTLEEKLKISDTLSNTIQASPTQIKERSKRAKESWNNKTELEKEMFIRQGQEHIRQASKTGSKLEHFLFDKLVEKGYNVELHKTHLIRNENLHLDLFLPKNGIVIEVDGPSHYKNIWGDKNLNRNIQSDNQKNSLVLMAGLCMIRVRNSSDLTMKKQYDIVDQLVNTIEKINKKFPARRASRLFEIGE